MSMSTATAQTVIVTTGIGVLGLAAVTAAKGGAKPTTQRVIGTAVATVALSATASVAPQIAGPLALLWAASALIVSGAPALSAVATATGRKPAKATPRPQPRYVST